MNKDHCIQVAMTKENVHAEIISVEPNVINVLAMSVENYAIDVHLDIITTQLAQVKNVIEQF